MSNDSRFVLSQLTRSGIWSKWCNLLEYKHLVLEADSVVTHLCRYCINKHIKHQKALMGHSKSQTIDYYSATLINFQELAQLIEQLLDYFAQYAIELIIVYRGKHMEAPLFGLGPAQFKKNTQRASESLLAMINYETSLASLAAERASAPNEGHKATLDRMRPTRPNLALNLFKQIVNSRRGGGAPASSSSTGNAKPLIQCHQAFYCPYPTCARLARDFKCPVMTNDGDFVVMDVRRGFILFEEFFASQLVQSNTVSRHPSVTGSTVSPSPSTSSLASVSSMARNQLPAGPAGRGGVGQGPPPRSASMDLASSKSLFQQRRRPSNAGKSTTGSSISSASQQQQASRRAPPKQIMVRFHFHRSFLLQHPGLNPTLALQLFPLTCGEFLVQYAKSLVRLRIYDREFHERDLIVATADQKSFKKYHMAAARLELVMRFLCAKNSDTVPNLIRGEASRLSSPIEQDYQELHNYYAVSYHFKGRLKLVLRQSKIPLDGDQLNHVETSLLKRECTADFWLSLLCCSLGRLASVDYNKSMQFEDLQTRHSARSMMDRPKRLMMCLLGAQDINSSSKKLPKSQHSPTMTSEQRKLLEKRGFSTTTMTVIDRQGRQLVERSVAPTINQLLTQTQQQAQFEQLRSRLNLTQLAKQTKEQATTGSKTVTTPSDGASAKTKSDAIALINLAFEAGDMTKLSGGPGGHHHLSQRANKSNNLPNSSDLLKLQNQPKEAQQLAILLSLHRYTLSEAMRDDQYFIKNYLSLGQHFEIGLVNHHFYRVYAESQQEMSNRTSSRAATVVSGELRHLFDLVHRHDLEHVTDLRGLMAAEKATRDLASKTTTQHSTKSSASFKEPITTKSTTSAKSSHNKTSSSETLTNQATKLVRHLIELLNGAIEAHCELNAFLNYPMPQLQLQYYNPILLFNLTLFSYLSAHEDSSANGNGGATSARALKHSTLTKTTTGNHQTKKK